MILHYDGPDKKTSSRFPPPAARRRVAENGELLVSRISAESSFHRASSVVTKTLYAERLMVITSAKVALSN